MKQSGVTLLELLVTLTILTILASVALPFKVSTKRTKEIELRQNLRVIRAAIDAFHLEWARDGDTLTGPACVKNRLSCKGCDGALRIPEVARRVVGGETHGRAGDRPWHDHSPIPPVDPVRSDDGRGRLALTLLPRSRQHQRLVWGRCVRCYDSESGTGLGWHQIS